MTQRAVIVFSPSGIRHEISVGNTVLQAAREAGVDLDSVCGGRGICGRCQIEVGTVPGRDGLSLSEPGPMELNYRGKRLLLPGRRLGCVARVLSDVIVEVPPDSQVHRAIVRKSVGTANVPVDPVVRLHYVEVEEPTMTDARGEQERLAVSLGNEWGLDGLKFDLHVTKALPGALDVGRRAVTVAVHEGSHVIAVWPGIRDRVWGVAFDVGSTTIAGYLCDLVTGELMCSAGVMNPQIRFGEDLMSRVSYAMMREDGAERLTEVASEALNELIAELVSSASGSRTDILDVTLVGNPIMHHLVLGLDPTPLGAAPFALATDSSVLVPASTAAIDVHPGARLYVLPCIAGHVGADAAAAILSEGLQRGEAVQLLVDVGTNAEIMLGGKSRLLVASSPTGPAFEGAQISSGQRATPGAIERVRIDPDTLEPRYKVIGCDLWSDESGFAEQAAPVTGICGSGIIEAVAELFLARVVASDGSIVADNRERLIPDGRTTSYVLHDLPIHVTQNDVRAIQLAKAALYAGCRLLMDELGVDHVDEIRLAGGFGSSIDPMYAMTLGMIPDCDLDRVSVAGNAAGTGAMIALLSKSARREIEDTVTHIEKIETAIEPGFQEHFVAAMGIPHSIYAFPQLAAVVDLPAVSVGGRRTRANE